MSEPVPQSRYQLLADHLGTGVTLSYLALVAIGMFHSVLGYRHFGINILDYAEASDFLLAPFRDPMVMLVTVLPAVLAWAYLRTIDKYSTRAREKRRAAGKTLAWWESSDATLARMKPFMPLLPLAMAMLWVFVSADASQRILAAKAMRGEGQNVVVELTNGTLDGGTPRRPPQAGAVLFRADTFVVAIAMCVRCGVFTRQHIAGVQLSDARHGTTRRTVRWGYRGFSHEPSVAGGAAWLPGGPALMMMASRLV